MTDWTALHSDVHVSGGDGFSFLLLEKPLHSWDFQQPQKQSTEEIEFVKLCIPGHKPRIINGVEVPMEPDNALRMYLCASMSATFAYGTCMESGRPKWIIGSRSQKDIFKLKLKFPETEARKVWDSNTLFYIRVAEGDSFSDDGSATIGARRTHSNEGW